MKKKTITAGIDEVGRGCLAGPVVSAAVVLKKGINLIGYASHVLGIGEDLRSTVLALDQVRIKNAIIDFPPGSFKGREEKTLEKRIQKKEILILRMFFRVRICKVQ